MTTLTALCAAVAAYYKEQGDRTKAGVVIACLDHDPDHFYASVVRYPGGPYDKHVVVSTHRPARKYQTSRQYLTAEEAIADLAVEWYKLVKPAPVESTLEVLRRNISMDQINAQTAAKEGK